MRAALGFLGVALAIVGLWAIVHALEKAERETASAKAKAEDALVLAHEALIREALADLAKPETRADGTIAILQALRINAQLLRGSTTEERDALIAVAYENRREAEQLVLTTEKEVRKFAFAPDGKHLALIDSTNIYVVELETGAVVHHDTAKGEHIEARGLQYTKDELLVVWSDKIERRSFDGKTLKRVIALGNPNQGADVDLSPDGRVIVARASVYRRAGEDYEEEAWPRFSSFIHFSPDSQRMTVSANGYDNGIDFLDVDTQKPFAHSKSAFFASQGVFSPNNDGFIMWSGDTARIVDLPSAKDRLLFQRDSQTIELVEYALDGSRVFIAAGGNLYEIEPETDTIKKEHSQWTAYRHMTLSPDQRRYASATLETHRVHLMNLDQDGRFEDIGGHDDAIDHIGFSPYGPHLFTASNDKKAVVWRLDHRGLVKPLRFPDATKPHALRFDTNARAHALFDGGNKPGVWAWNLEGEASLIHEQSHPSLTDATLFDDTTFIADRGGDLQILDAKTMKRRVAFAEHFTSIRLDPKAPRAVGCRKECEVFDAKGVVTQDDAAAIGSPPKAMPMWAKYIRGLPGGAPFTDGREVAVDPEGKHAIVVGADENIGVMLDLSYGSLLRVICAVARKHPSHAKVMEMCP